MLELPVMTITTVPSGASRSTSCNVMSQAKESLGLSASEHIERIYEHIRPFETKQIACPEPSDNIEQDHGSFEDIEGAEKHLNFFDFEHRRDLLPFGALAYPLDRVAIEQLMA